jgi:two-component system sensor histidine kinase/response regulator
MTASAIRILLIDDDEDDFLIIKSLLNEALTPHPELEWIAEYKPARSAIEAAEHDMYLIDYRLGEMSGLDLLEGLNVAQRSEPFIILTGAGDESIERQAMTIGVSDYLVKGMFSADLLRRVIRYSLQRKHLEAQRIKHFVELNRSKDEFIAVTSHQLRTPATAVKQYLAVVLEGYAGDIDPEQGKLLHRAYASNDRQLKIVDDIMRIAQLDLHKVTLQLEPVDILELVERCIQENKLTTEERKQAIHTKHPKHPVMVNCDPAFVAMAIGNLLDNASKYSSANTTITVDLRSEGKTMKLDISDHGVGIAKEDLPKLFKKFSRVDNPLSIEVGGTGLGLYWAKSIIKMQNGDILVDSKKDVGSTFTLTLPLVDNPNKAV